MGTVNMTTTAEVNRVERIAYVTLLGFAASLQVSIAAANILLALTAVLWLWVVISRRERIEVPAFFWPLAAYGGWTLVAAAFSIDPRTSLVDSKQLLLFAIVPIAYRLLRGHRSLTAVDVVISVAALSAAIGIIQFGILKWNDTGQRPQGALSHYMTYSGLLMLVACLAVARVLFWPKDRTWPLLVLPALIVALVATLTRSAWVGACAGIGLLLLFRDFRLIGLLPVVAAIFLAVAPPAVMDRIRTMVQVEERGQQTSTAIATVQSNQDRIAMLRSGVRMIRDHPLTGVGPDMVMQVYPVYRDKGAVNQLAPHLHNVPMQIAAERGLPALALWLAMLAVLVRDYFRQRRGAAWLFLSNAGLACVAATIAAGMFEYNFGDSEFLMLFLLVATLPYAAAARDDEAA
ncbi:MAG TPA: O-antigen ligase family protein [Vicinamibacterales bacterium]|nr:O-antigen ligase family protein [Vicinamibacterales bacterium]